MKRLIIVLCVLFLTGCVSAASKPEMYPEFEKDDYYTLYNSATVVELKGNYEITKEGTYMLSGNVKDSQVIVNTGSDKTVRLILCGVSMYCPSSAPIYVKQAGKVIISLDKDTSNTLLSAENCSAIFAKSDITINGSGKLNIVSGGNGINTEKVLKITGGTIDITSADSAMVSSDYRCDSENIKITTTEK